MLYFKNDFALLYFFDIIGFLFGADWQ